MKTSKITYILALIGLLIIVSCSVKKDKVLNRNYHALTSKYNILFHGNEAYDEALRSLKQNYFDDFWEILPVERIDIQVDPEKEFQKGPSLESNTGSLIDNFSLDGNPLGEAEEGGGSGFQLSESKAVKAIQKHSMYIRGREKNSQMNDAYILLGKTRYYDGRFIPALEAFNYILYKFPDSDKIEEAKVWREKTNLRLKYYDLAIKNLKQLLKEKRGNLSKQIESDANATLAQGYINLSQLDSAATTIARARDLSTVNEERARYSFILGQLYVRLNEKEKANEAFQRVIDMKRNSPRPYIIYAYAEQFRTSSSNTNDSVAFLKLYSKLLKDRENRNYLDVLNRQVGLFYEGIDKDKQALKYLKIAVSKSIDDKQLKAKNYLSIAEIYFNTAGYAEAGQYYDSALAILPPKAKETFRISKRRESLRDVVEYESIAKKNDSILRVVAMSDTERTNYYQEYVDELRKEDYRKLQKNLKGKGDAGDFFNMPNFGDAISQAYAGPDYSTLGGKKTFYFYSTQASSFGKLEFKKRWGNRSLADNWRWSSSSENTIVVDAEENTEKQSGSEDTKVKGLENDPRYDINTYITKLPKDEKVIADLKADRDFAYFQLGALYSERFKRYDLGTYRLESLLEFDPAERLVLPAMYKLYTIYLEIDLAKAEAMKRRIIADYPESRYAKLLQNLALNETEDLSPEQLFTIVYKSYQEGEYVKALNQIEMALINVSNEEYVSKFELLKANILARTEGVEKYKEALNFLALTYSSTPEGKEANRLLDEIVPKLESKQLITTDSKDWKLAVAIPFIRLHEAQTLKENMEAYASRNAGNGVKFSIDFYTQDTTIFVLHGFKNELGALEALQNLNTKGFVGSAIQTENYVTVQIKKNWDAFLSAKSGSVEQIGDKVENEINK